MLGRRHGGCVQGVGQRLPDGHLTKKEAALLPQRPALPVILDGERRVLHQRRGG